MFSGDKLLGGPQAGIIAEKGTGRSCAATSVISRSSRGQADDRGVGGNVRRVLRGAVDEIPALRMIRMSVQEIKRRAENFLRELTPELPLGEIELEIADGSSLAGGGSTRRSLFRRKLIRIASARYSAAQLEQRLRADARGNFGDCPG